MTCRNNKPLNGKAYSSIPHLPGSLKISRKDKGLHEGAVNICTKKLRRNDRLIVQEKLDGSCCAVAKINGIIIALVRAGYPAYTSPYKQHHIFNSWVIEREMMFKDLLNDGERIIGEWLWQAHGTRYALRHDYFVALDIMAGIKRIPYDKFKERIGLKLPMPYVLHDSKVLACDIPLAMKLLGDHGHHGAIDKSEGAVWRLETDGKVNFLAKFVRREAGEVGRYLIGKDGKQMEVRNEIAQDA